MSEFFCRIPKISDHITTRFLGDEAFIMNLKNLKTYALNTSASHIWSLIDGSATVDEILKKVIDEYDISEKECREAVTRIINYYCIEKLVVMVNPHE